MTRGRARLAMSEGLSVWLLEAPDGFGDAAFHAHHAIQLSVTFEGVMELFHAEQRLGDPVLAVAADAEHRFAARGLIAFLFIEPEGVIGRAAATRLLAAGGIAAVTEPEFLRRIAPLRQAIDPGLTSAEMLEIGWHAVSALAPGQDVSGPDERIRRIIERATAHPEESLAETAAAAGVHLSPDRLRHLFVEQTGLAFKTYMLWLRLVHAVKHYSEGQSLTGAAHAAGFADSAHFSRTFKRTFGLPATTLTRL